MAIDLNADVGEGLDEVEAGLIPLVTSVNVACGGHAGDEATMRRTMARAIRAGAAVGAHPGYPDRVGFGRRELGLSERRLRDTLRGQLIAAREAALGEGASLVHVKPHGALYGRAAADATTARLVAEVVLDTCGPLVLVGPDGSQLVAEGRAAGMPVALEAFADRAYEADGSLRPRSAAGAVVSDPRLAADQAVSIARDGRVRLDEGAWLPVRADTICLHGDTPGAIANARAVREALARAGIALAPLGRGDRAGAP